MATGPPLPTTSQRCFSRHLGVFHGWKAVNLIELATLWKIDHCALGEWDTMRTLSADSQTTLAGNVEAGLTSWWEV